MAEDLNNNVTDALRGILSDPDAMKKVSELAESLFGPSSQSGGEKENDDVPNGEYRHGGDDDRFRDRDGDRFRDRDGGDRHGDRDGRDRHGDEHRLHVSVPDLSRLGDENQIRLINALKPYLSPKRREAAESILRILKMLKLTDLKHLLGDIKQQ
ncbi:MAG: hypothetical protein PUE85_05805 [Firmicutes bacterium]|nr:hypothetical protein [Bacillota bacterium]